MRPIYQIAKEIKSLWKNVSPYAKPYLDAMSEIDTVEGQYYADSNRSIILYFLSNAASFKGEDARRIKNELKTMVG